MTGELDVYGVFVPSLAAWMLLAFVVSLSVRRVLTWGGLYHWVCFDFALYVIVLGIVVAVALPLTS